MIILRQQDTRQCGCRSRRSGAGEGQLRPAEPAQSRPRRGGSAATSVPEEIWPGHYLLRCFSAASGRFCHLLCRGLARSAASISGPCVLLSRGLGRAGGVDRAPALIDEPLICPEYAFSRRASSCLAHKCEFLRLRKSETTSLQLLRVEPVRPKPAATARDVSFVRFGLRVSVSEQKKKECCFKSLICSPFSSQNANVCTQMKEGIIRSSEAHVCMLASESFLLFIASLCRRLSNEKP